MKQPNDRLPVILDTDIGGDIDDTWALSLLLKCPELDARLIVSNTEDTEYRAAIIARLLEVAGRTDVPVGVGIKQSDQKGRQVQWIEGYSLDSYPGRLYRDGVRAIIETIEASTVPVTLICIGPLTNIAEVLRRAPHVARKTRFVGMLGCIERHQDGIGGAIAEWNVLYNLKACQVVFQAPWLDMTITPLDTCGQVRLRAPKYAVVRECRDPLVQAVIENYRSWLEGQPDTESSILYDTVAVHLAYSTEFLEMKKMNLRVTNDGFTVPDDLGIPVNVALDWTAPMPGFISGLDAFEDLLILRLTGVLMC